MAITLTQEPQLYTPSDNPVTWVFSSDETAQPNFSFYIELYFNAVLHSVHQVFPESGEFAHFDASEACKAEMLKTEIGQTLIVQDAGNWMECEVVIYEKYGDPATLQASINPNACYPFKACLSNEEFEVWNYIQYTAFLLPGSGTFLTDFNHGNHQLQESKDFYLQIITDLMTGIVLYVEHFDSSNNSIYASSNVISDTFRIAQFNLNSDLITVFPGTAYIQATIKKAGVPYSETIQVNYYTLTDECSIRTQVIWINKFGAYDQFLFTHNLTESAQIAAKSFGKQFGQWNGTTFEYKAYKSGTFNYLKLIADSGKIISGKITQDIQNSLVQVYESPNVVFQTGTNTYKHIEITNTSWNKAQLQYADDLIEEVVDYKLSNGRKSLNA